MNFRQLITCFLLIISLLAVTSANASDAVDTGQEAWLKPLLTAWAEEDNAFKNSPTSPLAGVQRFEVNGDNTVYFAVVDGQLDLSLDQIDQLAFSLTKSGEQWQWTGLDKEINLLRVDEALPSGSFLASGDHLQAGRLTVQFYLSAEKVIVLVFDPDTQRIRDFETLDRFEADPKFAVTAKIVKFDSPEQLDMITGLQQFKKQYRYAKLQFEIDGAALELTAYKHALEGEGSGSLFVPFTDKTTGKQTYGGGRYLFADEPAEGDEIQLDFNLVINPLCSYADIYNCIVPTLENKLPIAIQAGVKKYDYKR
jgi:uncharacterized protein (DUF1684 family)